METFFCSDMSCNKTVFSRGGRDKHMRMKHSQQVKIHCQFKCGKMYPRGSASLRYHERTCDKNQRNMIGYGIQQQYHVPQSHTPKEFYVKKTAHNENYKLLRKEVDSTENIQKRMRDVVMHDIYDIITKERNNIKFQVTVSCIFRKTLKEWVYTEPPPYFKTTPVKTTTSTNLKEILREMYLDLWNQIEEYIKNGSGWNLYQLCNVDVQVSSRLYMIMIYHHKKTKYQLTYMLYES